MSERGKPTGYSVYGETWVFECIVGAIPGVDISDRAALLVQFFLFEAFIVAIAATYDRWGAVLPGTAAILVATAGSAFMLDIGNRIRSVTVPRTYRQLLFSTSLEVVFGVVGYAAVLTILFVYQPRHGPTLLESVLGPQVPLVAAFLFFLILWDIAYRIGTGWWIALLAIWRAFELDPDAAVADELRAIDYRAAVFALLQLTLLPFVWDYRLLATGLVGHVLALLVLLVGARLKTGR
ncbi:DUF7530 family protein [Halanaeroarchaeum sulfurireducens]|uniref:Uncharacterized protein n=1 Tax=Halanaeroarchaeum sulfurireducens TaxID=1604004 RepID=A0A0N9N7H3_9EURY|nr:hypothetical protein [Halanaeroarchaeum sulfurireducens]ALG82996.1 hypothetical protein HLASA_2126 [Halanaeroarchaeum sulfurireducens]